MTCLIFVLLKAFQVFECPYDWPMALGLLGLDVIGMAEWYRILLHKTGR